MADQLPLTMSGLDPSGDQGLLEVLRAIRGVTQAPLIPNAPLAILGTTLSGLGAGLMGQATNPAIQMWAQHRRLQMEALARQAQLMAQQAHIRNQEMARLLQIAGEARQQRAEERREQNEAARLQIERERLTQAERHFLARQEEERRKAEVEKEHRDLTFGKSLLTTQGTEAIGAKLLSDLLAKRGYTFQFDPMGKPPEKRSVQAFVTELTAGLPLDQAARRYGIPLTLAETIARAYQANDESVLSIWDLPSRLAVEDAARKRATAEVELQNKRLQGVRLRQEIAEAGKPTVSQLNETTNRYLNTPGIKEIVEAANGYKTLNRLALTPSPAGDVSMIFQYYRIIEPTGIVRESEQDRLKRAASLPDRIGSYARQLLRGEMLTPEQRQDLVRQARKMFYERLTTYRALRQEWAERLKRRGIDPEDVLIDLVPEFKDFTLDVVTPIRPPSNPTQEQAKAELARLMQGGLSAREAAEAMRKAGWR